MIRNVGSSLGATRPKIFPVVSRILDGCDRRGFFVSVLCCHPDCKQELLIKSHSGHPLAVAQVIKIAENKGWKADKHGYALCRTHTLSKGKSRLTPQQKRAAYCRIRMTEEATQLREVQRERDFLNGAKPVRVKSTEETPVEPITAIRPDLPRTPELKDRRRILECLEEFYDTSEQSYVGVETDESIAKRLNMPRKWITDIRDQFFGPEGNQLSEALKQEVATYTEKCASVVKDALELATRAEELEKFGRRLQEKVGVPLPPKH